MRGKIAATVAAVCLLLSGCEGWMDGEYVSVKPHTEQGYRQEQEIIVVENYQELRTALAEMVENGVETGVLSVEALKQNTIEATMDNAVRYVRQTLPVGAYAVDTVSYEVGTTTGLTAVAVNISYNHNRSEIKRIRQVQGMEAAEALITAALEQCETGIVLKVEDYAETDLVQLVRDHALKNPASVMETPQVTANVYPESGNDRVVELIFTYQTSRESLRSMQSYVQPVFSSASLYVAGDGEESVKFSQLFSFLMERNDYTVETSITPAYSLLRHGVGDSRAFAMVYAAMCRKAGLEAMVISGTRAGEPWVWNLICENGVYYHVDLLQSHRVGVFRKMTDSEMSGYVWDYTAYPACG